MKVSTPTPVTKQSELGRAILTAPLQKGKIHVYLPNENIIATGHPILPSALDIIEAGVQDIEPPLVAAGAKLAHLILDFRTGGGLHNAPWTVKAAETMLTGTEIAVAWPPWQAVTAQYGPIINGVHAVFTKGAKTLLSSVSQPQTSR